MMISGKMPSWSKYLTWSMSFSATIVKLGSGNLVSVATRLFP